LEIRDGQAGILNEIKGALLGPRGDAGSNLHLEGIVERHVSDDYLLHRQILQHYLGSSSKVIKPKVIIFMNPPKSHATRVEDEIETTPAMQVRHSTTDHHEKGL
jgi:hypothetical protein